MSFSKGCTPSSVEDQEYFWAVFSKQKERKVNSWGLHNTSKVAAAVPDKAC